MSVLDKRPIYTFSFILYRVFISIYYADHTAVRQVLSRQAKAEAAQEPRGILPSYQIRLSELA